MCHGNGHDSIVWVVELYLVVLKGGLFLLMSVGVLLNIAHHQQQTPHDPKTKFVSHSLSSLKLTNTFVIKISLL